MENPNIHKMLRNLKKVNKKGDYWHACCPAHDDQHESLSVSCTDDGKILVNCHVGCDPKEIVYASGMTMKEMFPEKKAEPVRKMTATYDYVDADGVLVYQTCRFEWMENGVQEKSFQQRRPDGRGDGKFTWAVKGMKKILYRLPELLAAPKDKPVFIVEGEKQVDYLRALGFIATCTSGGAGKGKWPKALGKFFADRDVVIVPDCDPPNKKTGKIVGAEHAVLVADSCLTHAATVHVLQLPNCGEKWGLDDWLEAGNTTQELDALLQACPQYPEGEIITVIPPTVDDELADPLQPYRDLLADIGVPYCAQTEEGKVEIFSTDLRKFSIVKSGFKYDELIRYVGTPGVLRVKGKADDPVGEYSVAEVQVAVSVVSCYSKAIKERRGQGCWNVDENRMAILSGGEMAVINGRPTLTRVVDPQFEGKGYGIGGTEPWLDFDLLEQDLKLRPQDIYQKELDDVVKMIEQFHFLDVKYRQPEMIAGLLLATMVQACWPMRPQVFLIGQSYSGKTTLMEAFDQILALQGDKFSQPTEAALRGYVKTSAKAVLLDEVEKSKARKSIFEMIRAAARGDKIIRSSASQVNKEFSINNIFWCAAIEPGVIEEADKTRFLVVEMKVNRSAPAPVFPKEEVLREMGEKLARLAICSFRPALKHIEAMKHEPYSETHGRLNECYAVPAAAYAAARGMNEAEAVQLFHEFMGAVEDDESIENDHEQLLLDIMYGEVRVGNQVASVYRELHDPVQAFPSEDVMGLNGIMKDLTHYYFNRKLMSKQILAGDRWRGVRVDLLLKRFKGAERKKVRFGPASLNSVRIPIESIKEVLEEKVDASSDFDPFGSL